MLLPFTSNLFASALNTCKVYKISTPAIHISFVSIFSVSTFVYSPSLFRAPLLTMLPFLFIRRSITISSDCELRIIYCFIISLLVIPIAVHFLFVWWASSFAPFVLIYIDARLLCEYLFYLLVFPSTCCSWITHCARAQTTVNKNCLASFAPSWFPQTKTVRNKKKEQILPVKFDRIVLIPLIFFQSYLPL